MVSREEIREHVWGTLAVEFDSGLHTCTHHIRTALEDDSQRPQYVETVPRHGYRFVADVETLDYGTTVGSTGSGTRASARTWNAAYFRIDPRFAGIRDEPAFAELRERLDAMLWRDAE